MKKQFVCLFVDISGMCQNIRSPNQKYVEFPFQLCKRLETIHCMHRHNMHHLGALAIMVVPNVLMTSLHREPLCQYQYPDIIGGTPYLGLIIREEPHIQFQCPSLSGEWNTAGQSAEGISLQPYILVDDFPGADEKTDLILHQRTIAGHLSQVVQSLQWKDILSNPATFEAVSVMIRGVASFQGWICTIGSANNIGGPKQALFRGQSLQVYSLELAMCQCSILFILE